MMRLLLLMLFGIPVVFGQTTCASATTLEINGVCASATVSNFIISTQGYNCGGLISREIWFKFTLQKTNTVTITAAASNRNLAIQLLKGSCGSTTQVSCANANNTANSSQTETIGPTALASGTYFIKVLNVGLNSMNLTSLCLTTPSDCSNAMPLCTESAFTIKTGAAGNTVDLTMANAGCLTALENESAWFFFNPATSGTFEMDLQTTEDYDFAIWEANSCTNLGTPVRCSYAEFAGQNGITSTHSGNPVTDFSENSTGDGFLAPLPVTAGKNYFFLIDNYYRGNTQFTLDVTLPGGATFNCAPTALPTHVVNFSGDNRPSGNNLQWTVVPMASISVYTIQRSVDGKEWNNCMSLSNSGEEEYNLTDYNYIRNAVNYYRLTYVDIHGNNDMYGNFVSIDNRTEGLTVLGIVNVLGQPVELTTSGIIYIRYSDGSIKCVYNPG